MDTYTLVPTKIDVRINDDRFQKQRKTRVSMFCVSEPNMPEREYIDSLYATYADLTSPDEKERAKALRAIERRRVATMRADLIPHVLSALGLPPETSVRYSRTAGCSCGCSPGFIIDADLNRYVYVDFTAAKK